MFSLIFPCRSIYAQQVETKINPAAVWNPTMADMQKISAKCGLVKDEDLYSCFVNEIESSTASEQSVEFVKLLGGRGYMKAFEPIGIVDIAFVYYPFEKENHEGCFIVNGNPNLIGVDDYSSLNMDDMKDAPEYIQLKNKYPNMFIYPGDRAQAHYPIVENLPNGGEKITINYALRDGCSHCQLIGFADFGFYFDSTGSFKGTKFSTLKKSVILDSEIVKNNNSSNVFTEPSQEIVLTQGEQFVIALRSNHSAGYKWELAEPLEEDVVTLIGSDYLMPYQILPNVPGKETWNFRATGRGATVIKFKYVRNWQNETKEFQNVNFTLEVN
jgi:predicted secreted protein